MGVSTSSEAAKRADGEMIRRRCMDDWKCSSTACSGRRVILASERVAILPKSGKKGQIQAWKKKGWPAFRQKVPSQAPPLRGPPLDRASGAKRGCGIAGMDSGAKKAV